ncbi:MAG: GIY-YIG nuclease family protein [Chitinophagales bacterium]
MQTDDRYYVYILRCCDDTLYTGVTKDLDARVEKHNQGVGARYTRGRRPVALVYSEPAVDKSQALKREIQIKQMSRASKLALIDRYS